MSVDPHKAEIAIEECCKEIVRLRTELDKAQARLVEIDALCHTNAATPQMRAANTISCLRAENDQLKSDLAKAQEHIEGLSESNAEQAMKLMDLAKAQAELDNCKSLWMQGIKKVEAVEADLAKAQAELTAYREGGLTEEILRRHDGSVKLGKGMSVTLDAEWERMKAEVDNLRKCMPMKDVYQTAVDERAHFAQECERLKSDLAKAQAELDVVNALLELPDDYCLVCGGQGGHYEGCKGASGLVALSSILAQERRKLEVAQSENARLAAALEKACWQLECDDKHHCFFCAGVYPNHRENCNMGGTTALRDLLAPTVELLDGIDRSSFTEIPWGHVSRELARLRAAIDPERK